MLFSMAMSAMAYDEQAENNNETLEIENVEIAPMLSYLGNCTVTIKVSGLKATIVANAKGLGVTSIAVNIKLQKYVSSSQTWSTVEEWSKMVYGNSGSVEVSKTVLPFVSYRACVVFTVKNENVLVSAYA